jgi:ribosome maturation factor RimP
MTPKQQQLTDLIGPTVGSLGLDLWAIEIVGKVHRSTLRLVIDHPERPITVGDCEQVSRQVSRLLDVEDPLPERYTLEVSSPGIERSLYQVEHFQRFVGFEAKVKLKMTFEGRKNFTGVIVGVNHRSVLLQTGDTEYEFPEEQIERGHLIVKDITKLGGIKNGK